MKQKTAVILGATGLTGRLLTEKLINNPNFEKIKIITRRKIDLNSTKLETILISSLEDLKTISSEVSADIFFCCLGTTIKNAGSKENFKKVDYEAILDFANLAKKNKVEKFILISAYGANPDSSFYYNKIKGQTEEALKILDLNSLIIFRPSLLLGERTEYRSGEALAIKLVSAVSLILPQKLQSNLGTKIENLTDHMLKKAIELNTQKLEIIPPDKI